jgi:hypothetical protein
LTKVNDLDSFIRITLELKERRKDVEAKDKLGWYLRYMPEECKSCYNDALIDELKPTWLEKNESTSSKKSDDKGKPENEDLFDGDSMSTMFG